MIYHPQQPYQTPYVQSLPTLDHPMSSPTNPSRKRRAPGTVPTSMQTPYFSPPNSADQPTTWNTNNSNFMENSANTNPYGLMPSPRQAQFPQHGLPNVATPSTALARRGVNNQLVATSRPYNAQQPEVWNNFGDESLVAQQNGSNAADEHDNVEVLEEKAQKAKREAQAKRKQIPPFVQKLNRSVPLTNCGLTTAKKSTTNHSLAFLKLLRTPN